ncbi:MAG TPA: hypothetical protein VD794_07015 [Flavisolibacter sp.]|nr:hypothetical protein [Flavisolibacter sp.]
MINQLFTAILWGFSSSIIGVVYMNILSKEEYFAWWWQYGARYERTKPNLFKWVWGCVICFSGRFALFTFTLFTILAFLASLQANSWHFSYGWIECIGKGLFWLFKAVLCVSSAILGAVAIEKTLKLQ